MDKRILISLILLITPLWVFASESEVNNLRSWSDGALSWDDFEGEAMGRNNATSMDAKLVIEFDKGSDNSGDIQLQLLSIAAFARNNSFVGDSVRTDQNLRYQQLQYNLLEVYSRRLQRILNGTIRNAEIDQKRESITAEYEAKRDLIAEETVEGSNETTLSQWEYFINKELENSPITDIPTIKPSKFSYGGYVGTGYVAPTGDISKDFSGYVPFTIGLEAAYSRLKLKADISYGQPKIYNTNVLNNELQETYSTYASFLGVNTSLGFKIVKLPKLSITPFIGGYWSKYSWNVANFEYVINDEGEKVRDITDIADAKMDNYNFIFGIDFDYHFNRYIINGNDPLSPQKEQMTSSVRFTPFVTYANYSETSLKGCSIGLTISYFVNLSNLVIAK